MRVLAVGDVMGKAGRNCLAKLLPRAREQYAPDVIFLNGENAAGGFGLTRKIYDYFLETLKIDCVTMGNHWHDKREIYEFLPEAERLVLPANMMNVESEDLGYKILQTERGQPYAVINLIGRAFMHPDNRNPFEAVDRILARIPDNVKVRIVDMHAEASSEKQGMAQYLVGRVSLVYGTHSHVPTADERILGGVTGFVTDIGLTGAYDSVIGMRKDAAVRRLMTGVKKDFEPAAADPWMCAIVVDIDEVTGQCAKVERLRWQLDTFS